VLLGAYNQKLKQHEAKARRKSMFEKTCFFASY
jgi:hypothetical protein